MGSSPVTNMQPRYANPGMAQVRPGMAPGQLPQGGPPQGMPSQPPAPMGPQAGMAAPQGGANPQQLATALTQLGGGMR
jgi:hypothetical protein